MDVRMPVMDGVEAVKAIHTESPDVKIVMLTTFDDDEYVHAALENGAIGYLLKNRPPIELIHSIRAVRDGIMQLDPEVARSLLTHRNESEILQRSNEEILKLMEELTPREKEVLMLLSQALDNKQIARRLDVAEQTARNYISIIYSKLNVSHRVEIVKILDRLGY
jgi:DNA-binding NarL/FixJ family response regulator